MVINIKKESYLINNVNSLKKNLSVGPILFIIASYFIVSPFIFLLYFKLPEISLIFLSDFKLKYTLLTSKPPVPFFSLSQKYQSWAFDRSNHKAYNTNMQLAK